MSEERGNYSFAAAKIIKPDGAGWDITRWKSLVFKKCFCSIVFLLNILLTLSAQNISYSKEQKLKARMLCANTALLQGEKQEALAIYKEIRNNRQISSTTWAANDSLAFISYYDWDLETLYDCVDFTEKYLKKFPSVDSIQKKRKQYLKLYRELKENLTFQNDLCGIWVSDYTEDEYKTPYLILEIEKTDTGYMAHIHPNCQLARKYPTYSYWGKYVFSTWQNTTFPYAKCSGNWDTDSLNIHFADRVYRKASPAGSQIAAEAGTQIVESAKQLYTDVTSDPDFFRQPVEFRTEVYATTMATMGVGIALGVVSAILQNAKSYGYSVTLQGKYPFRGLLDCTLTEETLVFSTSTGKVDDRCKEINIRMIKNYPDYKINFIGYNNWLVGSHTFTKKEAKRYPEYNYKDQKKLLHNTNSYNRLLDSLVNSHSNVPDNVKEQVKDEFAVANSGAAFGIIPTDYGCYYGKIQNGKTVPGQAEHYFKQGNSWFLGTVKKNKREGEGINYQYNNKSEIIEIIYGTWKDGLWSGYLKWDNYVCHQHFEGNYIDGHRSGNGILTDTTKNTIYKGIWENKFAFGDCLNGIVEETDLNGNRLFNGEYKYSYRHGFGTEYYENGYYYEGLWKWGRKHGKGVLHLSNSGEIFQQTWKKGIIKHGMVEEKDQEEKIVYKGEYKNNKRHGFGTEYYEDGSYYEGNWKWGLKHGKGELHLSNSNEILKQTWKKGVIKQGMVEEQNQDGRIVYKGDYKNNKRHGFGTEIYENGCEYRGYWKNGQKHGEGVLRVPDSDQSYMETWKNGKLLKCKAI